MAIHFREFGDRSAPLMVFLHGGGVGGWMWDSAVQFFSRQYYCLVPDLPEHGESHAEKPFSIHKSAQLLAELIETRKNGRNVILIGFSIGAQITIQMVSDHPQLIDYAMINSALARPMPMMKQWGKLTIRLFFPLTRNRTYSKMQAKFLYIPKKHFETYFRELTRMNADTLVRLLDENMSFTVPPAFEKAKVPILVTVGQNELAILKRSAKDLLNRYPNSTGVIIPGIGHGLPLAMPELFHQLLEKWLSNGTLPEKGVIKMGKRNRSH